jgi:hypothetical protein
VNKVKRVQVRFVRSSRLIPPSQFHSGISEIRHVRAVNLISPAPMLSRRAVVDFLIPLSLPDFATAISSTINPPSRITFACIRCAERKVKCDRQRPCSACTKHNAECVFNDTKPTRKRQRRVKVQALADRLNQYEALLQEHGIDTKQLPGSTDSVLPSYLNDTGSRASLSNETASSRVSTGIPAVSSTGQLKFAEQ